MIAVLSKPLDQIGPGDVRELIDSAVPEGEQIEFKRSLRSKGDGTPDRWLTHGDGIGRERETRYLRKPSRSLMRTAARCCWVSPSREGPSPSRP